MKLLLTGGCGFIGSAVVRNLLRHTGHVVVNVDKMTYAASEDALEDGIRHNRHILVKADIADAAAMRLVFETHDPDAVMHLAAESHVDRSIVSPDAFIRTNVQGTFTLLEQARAYWSELGDADRRAFRFLHVSTDEVYGSLGPNDQAFSESTAYAPNSPYAASKAASDHLARAYYHTYGLPVITTNCSNNYGPFQFPEKLIPLVILNALEGKPLPVYGDGGNVRDWLFVTDHCSAISAVLERGRIGETYNIGGNSERKNLEVVQTICDLVDELRPPGALGPRRHLITFVTDRPGHDRRYAIDASKIGSELGWRPAETFEAGLRKTVAWYLDNPSWVDGVRTGAYRDWIRRNYQERDSQ